MTDKPVPLTSEGKAKLENELEALRRRRKDVAEMIHAAQEQGTSQNDAEYDDAKMEQGRVEGRILELEDILRRAKIIDEDGAHKSGRGGGGSRPLGLQGGGGRGAWGRRRPPLRLPR